MVGGVVSGGVLSSGLAGGVCAGDDADGAGVGEAVVADRLGLGRTVAETVAEGMLARTSRLPPAVRS